MRKSLMEPTAAMISSMRELEDRKNKPTIDEADDPWWEQRGGKKLPKVTPIVATSLVYAYATDTTPRSKFIKKGDITDDTKPNKKVTAISNDSRLLHITAACKASTEEWKQKANDKSDENGKLRGARRKSLAGSNELSTPPKHAWGSSDSPISALPGSKHKFRDVSSKHLQPTKAFELSLWKKEHNNQDYEAVTSESDDLISKGKKVNASEVSARLSRPTKATTNGLWKKPNDPNFQFDDKPIITRPTSAKTCSELFSAQSLSVSRLTQPNIATMNASWKKPDSTTTSNICQRRSKTPEPRRPSHSHLYHDEMNGIITSTTATDGYVPKSSTLFKPTAAFLHGSVTKEQIREKLLQKEMEREGMRPISAKNTSRPTTPTGRPKSASKSVENVVQTELITPPSLSPVAASVTIGTMPFPMANSPSAAATSTTTAASYVQDDLDDFIQDDDGEDDDIFNAIDNIGLE
eukprot:gene12257-25760_t